MCFVITNIKTIKKRTDPCEINIRVDEVASSMDGKCTDVCCNIDPHVEHTE